MNDAISDKKIFIIFKSVESVWYYLRKYDYTSNV